MPSDSRRNGSRSESERNRRSESGARSRTSWRDGAGSGSTRPTNAPENNRSRPDTTSDPSYKWRNLQRQSQGTDELPPLPDQSSRNGKGGKTGAGSWAIIFGAVLIAIVVGLLVLPFGPLAEDDPSPTPTSELTQATVVATDQLIGNETSVPTNAPAETVESDFLVCIDPGHGGWDFGRERMDMGIFGPPWFHESEVTLSMSFFLRDELESRGIAVVMTRETGGAVNWRNEDINGDGRVMQDTPQGRIDGSRDELQARINICNDAGADIMVSVHLNGYDDQSVSGYEIFYNSQRDFADQNRDLAAFIYREMTVAFDDLGYATTSRGYTDDINLSAATHEYGSEQFLIMIGPGGERPDYTIVPTAMPGVIIETLFVTNTNDANFILNPANQQRLAVSWADGIEAFRERYGSSAP